MFTTILLIYWYTKQSIDDCVSTSKQYTRKERMKNIGSSIISTQKVSVSFGTNTELKEIFVTNCFHKIIIGWKFHKLKIFVIDS